MKFAQSKTKVNLAKAFAGESQARGRYDFIAEKLRESGQHELSRVLLSVAGNELAHSKVFYDLIVKNSEEVVDNIDIAAGFPFKHGSVIETLNFAVQDETAEFHDIYPKFAEVAEAEGFAVIADRFRKVATVEQRHANLLGEVAMKMDTDKIYKSDEPKIFRCANCGFEHRGTEAYAVCPLCLHPQGFVQVSLENPF